MSRFGSVMLTAAVANVILGAVAIPTSASAAPPVVSAEPSALVYTVKNGDYLFGIAVKLNVRVTDLLSVNQLTLTSSIHPGDALVVPVGGTLPEISTEVAATPAPATPAPATAPAAGSTEYIVKNGDYLVRIAANNGVPFKALLSANKLTAASRIFPGTKLVLPPATLPIPASANVVPEAASAPITQAAPAPAPASPAAASTGYVVKNGDYLVGIAASNGVTLKALLAANSMTAGSAIFPGTKLVVPPATLAIPAPPTSSTAPSAQQPNIATMLTFLQGELGKPYLFNSAGPDSYDCSGLVVAAYKQIGIDLPHQSLLQSQKGANVDWHAVDIQAGDLIFQIGTGKTYISHVGIAISSTQWIQSARAGDVVKISPIPNDVKIQAVRRIVT